MSTAVTLLLIHCPIFERALVLGGGRHYDFAPFFASIKPYIRGADLALCQVETPMTPAAPVGYPVFNTPPELATAIRQTGWCACSTAGTHTLDQGKTEPDHRAARTARWHRKQMRIRQGVTYDQRRARALAAAAIREAALVKNYPPDLINVALERLVGALLELPGVLRAG